MNRILFSLVLVGMACANAAEELPFPKPSSFDSRKIARDPFTPVDSVGMAEKTLVVNPASTSAPDPSNPAALFKLTSISTGPLSIAIINNRAFAEGELFELRGEGNSVQRVTVLKIKDGSVDLDCFGRRVTLTLSKKAKTNKQ